MPSRWRRRSGAISGRAASACSRQRARGGRRCPARAAGSSRPGSTIGWSVRRGDVRAAVDDVPAHRSVILRVLYPPAALAPGAPYARPCARRRPGRDDRARAGSGGARGARQAPARGHAPPPVGMGARSLPPRGRPGGLLGASRTRASVASIQPGRHRRTCTSRRTTSRRRSCHRCLRNESSRAAIRWRPPCSSSSGAVGSR